MLKSVGIALLALAACNGASAKPDAFMFVTDAAKDAAIDAPPRAPNVVTLEAFGSPTLFLYRDGQGPWQTPQTSGMDQFALNVTNDYQWLMVCADASGFDAELQGATFADGSEQFGFCFAPGTTQATVAVTGQMVQAGSLWMGEATATSATPSWTFNLAMPTGTHDLIAVGGTQILFRRDVDITAATTLPNVDVVAAGSAMTAVPLAINGLGTDTLATQLAVFLANDFATISGFSTTLETPPASLLMQNDSESLELTATTPTGIRSADTSYTGVENTFTLMPALTGITYASGIGLAASWGALPDYTGIDLSVFAASSATSEQQHVSVTKNWLVATGAGSLTFDTTVPGYLTTWEIDLTGPYGREFDVDNDSGSVDYSTGVTDSVNVGLPPRPSHARTRARARALHAAKLHAAPRLP